MERREQELRQAIQADSMEKFLSALNLLDHANAFKEMGASEIADLADVEEAELDTLPMKPLEKKRLLKAISKLQEMNSKSAASDVGLVYPSATNSGCAVHRDSRPDPADSAHYHDVLARLGRKITTDHQSGAILQEDIEPRETVEVPPMPNPTNEWQYFLDTRQYKVGCKKDVFETLKFGEHKFAWRNDSHQLIVGKVSGDVLELSGDRTAAWPACILRIHLFTLIAYRKSQKEKDPPPAVLHFRKKIFETPDVDRFVVAYWAELNPADQIDKHIM
jgi:hypothetical protein